MSSTYQWIIEDTDNKGFTTTVVIDLEDDEDHHYQQQQQQQQQSLLQHGRHETQSEGRNSLSHRSHRSTGSRSRHRKGTAGGLPGSGNGSHAAPGQRHSGSGSGSHHSSTGSGGNGRGGGGGGYSRRPAWMTTSVYGAEPLDDSEEEREMSPTTAKRKLRATHASPVPAFSGALPLASSGSFSGVIGAVPASKARKHRQDAYGAQGWDSGLVHPVFDDENAQASGEDADEERDVDADADAEDEELPVGSHYHADLQDRERLMQSFAHPQTDVEGATPAPWSSSIVTEVREEEEYREPEGLPAHEHDDGRTSPVTATFYFTPNTNAKARAYAHEALHGEGILYPIQGYNTATTETSDDVATGSTPGARYNKKLQKKDLHRQQAEQQQHRESADGHNLSFSAAVEALAMRAHRQLHHMPDYDSDHEQRRRMQHQQEPPLSDSAETDQESAFDVHGDDSSGSPGQSPQKWDPFPCLESSDDDGLVPRRSLSFSSTENDFDRFQRQQREHQQQQQQQRQQGTKGNGIGAPLPAAPPPPNLHDMYDASGFFISPIHQLVAQDTSPWHQGSENAQRKMGVQDGTSRGAGEGFTNAQGEPFSFFFLGQGGLGSTTPSSSSSPAFALHPPSASQGHASSVPVSRATQHGQPNRPATSRRRTISSGSSILRVPVDVDLPSPTVVGSGRRRRQAGDIAGAPVQDHELAKAAEEGLVDNLSSVLATGRRAARGRARDGFQSTDESRGVGGGDGGAFFSGIRRARAAQSDEGRSSDAATGRRVVRKRQFNELSGGDEGYHDGNSDAGYSTSTSTTTSSSRGSQGYGDGVSSDDGEARPAFFPHGAQCGKKRGSHSVNRGGRATGHAHDDPYRGFTKEEKQVMKRLKRRRNQRRRLERATQECGGSQILGPCPSPSIAPTLELLPSSRADMREDLLESFFMDTKLSEDDFKLF